MALILKSNLVYLHLPRTGGTFLTEQFRKHGLVEKEIKSGPQQLALNNQLTTVHRDVVEEVYPRDTFKRFFFVRNPYDWYVSFYTYKKYKNKLDPVHYIDYIIQESENFDEFLHTVNKVNHGKGVLSFYTQTWDKYYTAYRYEEMFSSLLSIFMEANIPNSKRIVESIKDQKPVNQSDREDFELTPANRRSIKKLDSYIFTKYYPNV